MEIICLLAFIIFGFGCANGEKREQRAQLTNFNYLQGRTHLQRGHVERALQCFQKVIHQCPGHSAEAHFECGEIFLTQQKDPIKAIYHYREYLQQQPNSREAPLVRQRIVTAEKAFLSQIPPLANSARESHGELLHSLKLLQNENSRLKRQIVALKGRNEALSASSREEKSDNVSLQKTREITSSFSEDGRIAQQIYTVISGDTLSSISHKIYGSATHWKEIFDANRQTLLSPAQLRVGQQLVLPKIFDEKFHQKNGE
jgi:LysM repeat protein